MQQTGTFNDLLATRLEHISPAEQTVARFIQENREEVLIASASSLAKQTGTSDATVVRTVKALGFTGLEELRRTLVQELREHVSPASRMARTIDAVGNDVASVLKQTVEINQNALVGLERDISPELFQAAVNLVTDAKRAFIFGIGPSSAMADYFSIELSRLGLNVASLTQTGLLLADEIQKFRPGDMLIIFAYGRVYHELDVLLDHADMCKMSKILISDTLGLKLHHRVNLTLPVARGRVNMLSMHTATLALIEALLVGVAIKQPAESLASLETLNQIRNALSGQPMDL
jgi:DNA-binding MurR/RpiR family transcriptional regulator